MKRTLLTLLLPVAFILNTLAYSWLYVSDPQDWQKSGQGSIDEVSVTIRPKGIYLEYELYLTFSAKNLGFTAEDTVEVNYYFSLPKGSIVHDSWLWADDSIVHAKIMDRWTAYQIYEGIVKRRRDPSVLYKDWQDNYQLRIFPMLGDGQRKVKITYLIPANWSASSVSAQLPVDILEPSLEAVKNIKVTAYSNDEWKDPRILGHPELSFKTEKNKRTQQTSEIIIDNSYFADNLHISYDSPVKNGIYLSRYKSDEDGLYQMVFFPSTVFGLQDQRKVLIMFDFEEGNSYYTDGNEVFSNLKSALLNYLGEGDYFNIMISGQQITAASKDWIPADSASIFAAFAKLGSDPVKNFTDLPKLLETGIKFIHSADGKGELLLLSNSDNYGENGVANDLVNKLKELGPLPVTHVVDFYDRWYIWYDIGGNYFRGNEYLYTMLTRQSHGNYYEYNYWDNTVSGILSQSFTDMGGILNSFDLHTSLKDGFCYGRYDINSQNLATYLRRPILQVGKYYGNFPFVIEASGIYNGQVKTMQLEFNSDDIVESDSLAEEIWTGNFIQTLENTNTYDNKIVQTIIDASLKERVLSRYTAFLALEPGMESTVDPQNPGSSATGATEDAVALNSFGEVRSDVTGTDKQEFKSEEIQIRSFPNPFSTRVILQIALPAQVEWQRVKVEVFDMTGRKIKEFTPDDYNYNGYINIEWNGHGSDKINLAKGIYSVVVTGDTFKKQMKILKID